MDLSYATGIVQLCCAHTAALLQSLSGFFFFIRAYDMLLLYYGSSPSCVGRNNIAWNTEKNQFKAGHKVFPHRAIEAKLKYLW
jgi:hypothetical protein